MLGSLLSWTPYNIQDKEEGARLKPKPDTAIPSSAQCQGDFSPTVQASIYSVI